MQNIRGKKKMGREMDLELCFLLVGSGMETDIKEPLKITKNMERGSTTM